MIVSPIMIGLASASFSISVRLPYGNKALTRSWNIQQLISRLINAVTYIRAVKGPHSPCEPLLYLE